MDRVSLARLVVAGLAVAGWAYGYQTDNASVRLVAIGLLAVSLLLRFLRKKPEA